MMQNGRIKKVDRDLAYAFEMGLKTRMTEVILHEGFVGPAQRVQQAITKPKRNRKNEKGRN